MRTDRPNRGEAECGRFGMEGRSANGVADRRSDEQRGSPGKDILDRGPVISYVGYSWILRQEAFPRICQILPKGDSKIQLAIKNRVKLKPHSVSFVKRVRFPVRTIGFVWKEPM